MGITPRELILLELTITIKSMEEKINEIMENFDFENVHKVMVALEWEWSFSRGGSGIPSVKSLKERAGELLSDVEDLICEGDTITSSSGGFEAKYHDGCLSLSFIVEEWVG